MYNFDMYNFYNMNNVQEYIRLEGNPCHARTVIMYPKMFLLVENTHARMHTFINIIAIIIIIIITLLASQQHFQNYNCKIFSCASRL